MKKFISVLLALCMIFAVCVCANAEDADTHALQFNKDGKFTIIHLCDCQDGYPAYSEMMAFIYKVLDEYHPDLVVLGGDNTVAEKEDKEAAVEELCKPFVETETYFTLVFGNHDCQQGYTNPELFDLYVKYGGQYFLGTDLVDSVNESTLNVESKKSGTQFLPILASDGSGKAAYGLYIFDSGNYVYDEDGNELGYGSVEPYQIEWYRNVRDSYKDADGNYLPALAFQHIVVGDVYDSLYYKSAVDLGELGRSYYGTNYTFVPKLQNFDGFLNEAPCPGYYNFGQLDAMAEKGDVQAVFSGHDHMNSFDVEIEGIHVINTPACTYNSYSNDMNHGTRIITIDENTQTYTTDLVKINDYVINDSDFASAVGMSKAEAYLHNTLGDILLAMGKVFSVFGIVLDIFVK